MENEELLTHYLEKLRLLTLESLEKKEILTVMDGLKEAIIILEGEMLGY